MRTRAPRPRRQSVGIEMLEPRQLFSGGHPPPPPPPTPVVTFSNTDGVIGPTGLDLIGSMVGDQFTPTVTGTLNSATIAIYHPFATGSSVAGKSFPPRFVLGPTLRKLRSTTRLPFSFGATGCNWLISTLPPLPSSDAEEPPCADMRILPAPLPTVTGSN